MLGVPEFFQCLVLGNLSRPAHPCQPFGAAPLPFGQPLAGAQVDSTLTQPILPPTYARPSSTAGWTASAPISHLPQPRPGFQHPLPMEPLGQTAYPGLLPPRGIAYPSSSPSFSPGQTPIQTPAAQSLNSQTQARERALAYASFAQQQ
eukprot:m.79611 g.79611  ORF g.79611 m.79611 type:complete len:148 (-) comp14520_c2_seq1:251-694(-)